MIVLIIGSGDDEWCCNLCGEGGVGGGQGPALCPSQADIILLLLLLLLVIVLPRS